MENRLSSESSDYLVLDLIGQGAFAKVAKCVKSATNETVAVKIRKKRSATEAEEEDAILQKLRAFDPDTWHFVRWDSSFIYKAHLCQEFELLDMNLKEFVNMRHTSSLPLRDIRPILHQVATALQLLKSLGISHSDLKPENIMLVDHVRQPLKIKLIDFGSACDASKAEQGSCIQHRWYRAPETILGLPCNEAIDMWSLGCIAAELFLGFPLYPGSCDYERIWKITQTQGQLPGYFLSAGHKTSQFYRKTWPNMWKLMTPHEYGLRQKPDRRLSEADTMLQLDPTQRITPGQVLQHAFVTVSHLIDFCYLPPQKIKESILAIKCDRHTFANWPRPPVASQLGECLCAAHTGAAFIFPLRLNKMSGHRDIAIHSTRSPTISR
uniref:Protein kinase domain-containing protein n=1 Tax=Sander lucioperca TaxID=283035 RepID=A0A8C9Z977_SANLU